MRKKIWGTDLFLSCKITLMTMFYHVVLDISGWDSCARMCGCLCGCVFMSSGEAIAFPWSVCQWGYLRSKVEEGKNAKQPRAVLASKIYPPIFLRQILVSVNMASKIKAWQHSNKCLMCMPWVNDVNVIFISSECNSIHYCLFFVLFCFLTPI